MTPSWEPARPSADGRVPHERLLLRTWSDGEAAVVTQLLVQYGIRCRVVSDVTHAVLPFSVDGLGEVRVLVAGERHGEAVEILAEHRRQGLEVVSGGLGTDPEDEGEGA